jgi:hypothetical protein
VVSYNNKFVDFASGQAAFGAQLDTEISINGHHVSSNVHKSSIASPLLPLPKRKVRKGKLPVHNFQGPNPPTTKSA